MPYWWKYISYFKFLAWNWSLPLSIFVLQHEIRGERKYQTRAVGNYDLENDLDAEDWLHASSYQPINFFIAEKLFNQLSKEEIQSGFLDVGCGMGRAMAIAAAYGFSQIFGFDISSNLAAISYQQAEKWKTLYPQSSFSITTSHAEDFIIPNQVGVIFLFNPFDALVMQSFIQQVMNSLHQHPRNLKVLYANPVCKENWLQAGFTEVYHIKKLQYLEGVVLQWSQA